MKFNTENPGTWFYFNEENHDEGGVCVRIANQEINEEIQEKCKRAITKFHTDPKTRRTLPFTVWEYREKVDGMTGRELEDLLTFDYAIVDWREVQDSEGNEISCTKENKAMLMRRSVEFNAFVTKCLRQLNAKYDAAEEELEKN